jgi:hypothetical protein
MMALRRFTPACTLLAASLALTACSNDPKANMTAQGAGLGALGGAVLGGILGGRDGALIGAGIGAAAGGIGGYALGSEQQRFASAEQELAVRTEQAREIANTQRRAADNARRAAARYEQSLAPLRRQVANREQLNTQQRATLRQAIAERDAMRAQVEAGDKALDEIRASIASLREKGQNTSALEAEGRELAASNARLKGALDRMNGALGNIDA